MPEISLSLMARNLLQQSRVKSLCSETKYSALQFCRRCQSTQAAPKSETRALMKAWQIRRYGGNEELTWSESVRIPRIQRAEDILIQVHAASINMLDIRMRGGYGRVMLNTIRNKERLHAPQSEFPLILGRDFSGVVVQTGLRVKKYKAGDEVCGTVSPFQQGSHAEFTLTTDSHICPKPLTLSHQEAASFPYVASTAMTALCDVGELKESNTESKRVLLFGGSGGIGTFSIQLMKAWGAEVTTTCSTDAVELVTSLGADNVIDYKTQNVTEELEKIKGFDLILDIHGGVDESFDVLKKWTNAKFVTIYTPVLKDADSYGFLPGIFRSGACLGMNVLKGAKDGRSYRWALFKPSSKHLRTMAQMIDHGQIKPVIDQVFPFQEADKAYEKMEAGHARGKNIVSMV